MLDLSDAASDADDAAGWLARAVGARLTTPDRLRAAIASRPRLRWRPRLTSALHDIAAGCHSLLELLFLRDVERAHGLPAGERQVRRVGPGGTQYDDVVYRRHATVVELDGRAAHADRFRDMSRDNATVVDGRTPLRYGFGDVRHRPCDTAVQLAAVLGQRGWRGRPRRCRRADCTVPG